MITKPKIYTLSIILLLLFLTIGNVFANDSTLIVKVSDGVELFNRAYDAWDKDLFLKTATYFSDIEVIAQKSTITLYWQAVSHFYLVSYFLFGYEKDKDKRQAKYHIQKAIDLLQVAQKREPQHAEVIALLGTLYGMRIYLDPLTSVVLGKKVFDNIKKSLAIDSTNPRIYYLVGMSYYHTPSLLGGGFKTSKEYLLKAEDLYKNEQLMTLTPLKPRWGRSTCLGFLGNIYKKKKRYKEAKLYYQKALTVNPKDKMAMMGLEQLKNRNP